MQPLSRDQFDAMRLGASVLEEDGHGVKVLRLADGTFLKLFRRKSWLSKNAFFTPAQRFAENASLLQQRNIPCPQIIALYHLPDPYRSVVHYSPLAGNTLRQLLNDSRGIESFELLMNLADISDMRCLNRPLSKRLRARNYQHLLRYEQDWAHIGFDIKRLFS